MKHNLTLNASLCKFEPKQKYLADQSDSSESDESEDDVSDSGDEENYDVQIYNPYIPGTPDLPDLETLTKSLDLISQLDYVFAATVPVPVLSTIICWSFFR